MLPQEEDEEAHCQEEVDEIDARISELNARLESQPTGDQRSLPRASNAIAMHTMIAGGGLSSEKCAVIQERPPVK